MIEDKKNDLARANQTIEDRKRDVQKWRECADGLESALKEKGRELAHALAKAAELEERLLQASRPDAYVKTAESGGSDPATVGPASAGATGAAGVNSLAAPAAVAVAGPHVRPRVQLPTYTTSSDIHVHLKQMDNYFDLYPTLPAEEKIAILKFSFDVTTFSILQHIKIPAEKKADYDYLRQACIDRFEESTSARKRRLQFKIEKQVENQTFDQYFEFLLKAATRAFPTTRDPKEVDDDVTDQFIAGLLPSYAYVKEELSKYPPKDSRDALATAKRLLAARRYAVTTTATEAETLISTSATNSTLVTTYSPGWSQGRSRGYRATPGAPPFRTPESRIVCYNCGEPNHIAAHCPEPHIASRYNVQPGHDGNGRNQDFYQPSQSFPPYF